MELRGKKLLSVWNLNNSIDRHLRILLSFAVDDFSSLPGPVVVWGDSKKGSNGGYCVCAHSSLVIHFTFLFSSQIVFLSYNS